MNAHEILEELSESRSGGVSDWRYYNSEIVKAYRETSSSADRILLLQMRKVLMDAVEKIQISPAELETFREISSNEYRLLLMSDAMENAQEGTISPTRIGEIVRREVEAGRLSESDDFAQLALAGALILGDPVIPAPPPSLIGRVASWFRKA